MVIFAQIMAVFGGTCIIQTDALIRSDKNLKLCYKVPAYDRKRKSVFLLYIPAIENLIAQDLFQDVSVKLMS
jgi:hypothetical protein